MSALGVGGTHQILELRLSQVASLDCFSSLEILSPPPFPHQPYLRRSFSRKADLLYFALSARWSFFLFHSSSFIIPWSMFVIYSAMIDYSYFISSWKISNIIPSFMFSLLRHKVYRRPIYCGEPYLFEWHNWSNIFYATTPKTSSIRRLGFLFGITCLQFFGKEILSLIDYCSGV